MALSLVIVFIDQSQKLDSVTYRLRRILAPVQVIGNLVSGTVLAPLNYFQFVHSGEMRIKYLEQRNLELQAQVQEIDRLREENADLTKQLGVDVSKSHLLLPARVLGIDKFLEFQLTGSGTIQQGQTAVYLDNYIGKLVRADQGIGFVELATDPDSKVPAKTDSASGLVSGQFFSNLLLDRVSKSDTINVGDTVTTSGIGGSASPDLVLGKITKILPSADQLFQRAEVTPVVKVNDLKLIYIITD